VGPPEDEDQHRIRRAGQIDSFAFPFLRMVPRIPIIMPG
jgi:hypothetical protein